MLHELPLDAAVLHGRFSRELEPVLAVEPGDAVRFSVPNAGWEVERGQPFEARSPELDTGHALAGPIEVRGARTGQVLEVRIEEVVPASWGVTYGGPDHRIDWELGEGLGRALGREIRLAPFLGVLGMPPSDPGDHSTIPPRSSGGNIDCKELVAGTTLFLPIPVEGALFSAGDGHAAQGDGEVSGTAIEAPTSAQLTLDVADEPVLEWPIARIDGGWIALGFAESLEEAGTHAMAGMLALMERELGVSGADAMALASLGVDLRITQVVNGCVGVHAVLRDDVVRSA